MSILQHDVVADRIEFAKEFSSVLESNEESNELVGVSSDVNRLAELDVELEKYGHE